MSLTVEQAIEYRKQLMQIDLQTLEGRNAYTALRRSFIGHNEGYDAADSRSVSRICNVYIVRGVTYVGVGFNMERPEARKEWETAFGHSAEAPDFDKVLGRKLSLNKKQIERLLESGLVAREKELRRIYGDSWGRLKPNERLAIEDMYYQAPRKANAKSAFFAHIKEYAAAGEAALLDKALYQLRFANG